MGLLGSISVAFVADTSKFNTGVSSASGTLKGFGGSAGAMLAPVAISLLEIGSAALEMAEDSVKAAGDFQATMTKVQALAGVSAEDAGKASEAILQMSQDLGSSPQKMADGLYYIASAGYNAKDSLELLRLSTLGSKIGMTDTDTVANALTASLNALGKDAGDAQEIMDIMVETVSHGKTEFEDYAKVIGKISLNSKQAGIDFTEANAAFAQLTNVFPSSKQAADGLNALLQTSSRFDLLKSRADTLGIAFDTNKYQTMNLEERMRYLMQITGGNSEELTKLLGRQNAMAAITALSTNNFKDYEKILKDVKDAHGATDEAFAKTQESFNAQMEKLSAGFDVLKIRVGSALLPLITPLVSGLSDIIGKVMQWFSNNNMLGKTLSYVMEELRPIAKEILPLITNFTNGAKNTANFVAQNNILGKSFALIIQYMRPLIDALIKNLLPALGRLGAGIMPILAHFGEWLIKSGVLKEAMATLGHWWEVLGQAIDFVRPYIVQLIAAVEQFIEQVVAKLQPTIKQFSEWWAGVWPGVSTILKGVWDEITGIIQIAWAIVSGIIKIGLDILSGNWGAVWQDIQDMFKGIWEGMKKYLGGALDMIKGLIMSMGSKISGALMGPYNSARKGIEEFFNWVGDQIGQAGQNFNNTMHDWGVPGFANGVMNFQAGESGGSLAMVGERGPELIWLPNGSNVYPSGQFPSDLGASSSGASMSSSGDADIHVHVIFDTDEVAHIVGNKQSKIIRAKAARRVI
jgi:TP901 family phage tail tape measure protein